MATQTKTCRAAWGSCSPGQHCTLPEGHDGLHIDSRGEKFDGTGEWPGNPFRTRAQA